MKGRIYNWYNWGGYLIWKWYPKRKVFIDGRVAMYGEDLYGKWADVYDAQPGWQEHLDDYDVAFILVDSGMPEAFYADEDWTTIYWDDVALLLARNTPENEGIIRRYDCHITNPDVFARLRNRGELPAEVEGQLKDKIKTDASCALAYLQLGQFYFQQVRLEEAIAAFAKYIQLRPHGADVYNNIGMCYYMVDKLDQAVLNYEKSLELGPTVRSAVHLNLADAYFRQNDIFQASHHYKKAVAANPQSQMAHAKLANLYISQGMRMYAIKELEAALKAPEKTPGLPAQLIEKLRELTQPAQNSAPHPRSPEQERPATNGG